MSERSGGGGAGSTSGAASSAAGLGNGGGGAGAGGAPAGGAGGSSQPSTGGASGASGSGGAGEAGAAGTSGGGGSGGGGPVAGKSCSEYEGLPAECLCRDYANHAYLFCSTMRSWAQGSMRCGFFDMSLVKIESPAEDAWVLKEAKAIKDPRPLAFFWVGASSQGSPGVWHWPDGSIFWRGNASGTPVDGAYSNWRITSPQNTKSAACIFSDDNGWEEGDCAINRGYVCESASPR